MALEAYLNLEVDVTDVVLSEALAEARHIVSIGFRFLYGAMDLVYDIAEADGVSASTRHMFWK